MWLWRSSQDQQSVPYDIADMNAMSHGRWLGSHSSFDYDLSLARLRFRQYRGLQGGQRIEELEGLVRALEGRV